LLDFESDKEKESRIVSNDIQSMHNSIRSFYDKKNITKHELDLHNSILRQTKKLKDDEEKDYIKSSPPQ